MRLPLYSMFFSVVMNAWPMLAHATCTVEIEMNCVDLFGEGTDCKDTDCQQPPYNPFYYCPDDTEEHEVNDRDYTTIEERDYDGGPEINWGDDYNNVSGTIEWCERTWKCDYSNRCTAQTDYKCQVDFVSGVTSISHVQDSVVTGNCPDND